MVDIKVPVSNIKKTTMTIFFAKFAKKPPVCKNANHVE